MKITIDTKEDTREEIQKVIKMLSSLVGNQEVMSNQGDLFSDNAGSDSDQNDGSDIFNMFNTGSGSNTSSENITEDKKKEEKDDDLGIDIPEVEEYE